MFDISKEMTLAVLFFPPEVIPKSNDPISVLHPGQLNLVSKGETKRFQLDLLQMTLPMINIEYTRL